MQEVTIAQASTVRAQVVFEIDQWGWFFLEEIRMSWRPTGGGLAGVWWGLGHSPPAIVDGGAVVASVLDFYWEWSESRANQDHQNQRIPGDIFYRNQDGLVKVDAAIEANSNMTFHITPTTGPSQAGVLAITLHGKQCMNLQGG